jgi:hypothetical protein
MSRTPKIRNRYPKEAVYQDRSAHVMDAKYLVVDQPLDDVGNLGSRACTSQPPGWPEQTNRATNG